MPEISRFFGIVIRMFVEAGDLQRDIRPVLDRLMSMMLRVLVEALPVLQQHGGRHLFNTRCEVVLAESPGGETAIWQAVTPLQQTGGWPSY